MSLRTPGGRAALALALVGVILTATFGLAARPAEARLAFAQSNFVEEVVAQGLPFATGVAFAADGRMFVATKSGVVYVYVPQGAGFVQRTFIDISSVVNDVHDRGLLGIAVHPDFPATPYVYLLYTHDPPGTADNGGGGRVAQLMRVSADPAQGHNQALATDRVILLGTNSTRLYIGSESNGRDITRSSCMGDGPDADTTPADADGPPIPDCIPSDENSHTIGTVAFAPDGTLFVSTGDGANYTGVDPRALRSLDLDSLAGKVLRIDPITGRGLPGNPFFNAGSPNSNRSKVWSYGLRNPFRMAIHPDTGEPYSGDVGWNSWEEINTGKGANFGWPCYEGGVAGGAAEGGNTTSLIMGSYRTNSTTSAACEALYAQGLGVVQRPAFAYGRGADSYGVSGGASANAGAFYTGDSYRDPQGRSLRNALFFTDYNRRWIRYLTFDAQGVATVNNFAREDSGGPVQIFQGPDTNLYVVVLNGAGSQVRRIRYWSGTNTPPVAIANASATIGTAPMRVGFSSVGTYDIDAQPLTYSWSFGDGTSSTDPNPTKDFTQPGVYDVTLTVRDNASPAGVGTDTIRITVGNNPPLATITSPANGSTYEVGDVITYSGAGSSGGQPVSPSQMSWELRHAHNEHFHFQNLGAGAGGSFLVDDHGDMTWYRLCLTVTTTGPNGPLTDTRCVDLQPRKTAITIASQPVGVAVEYEDEGTTGVTPYIINPIVGSDQTVSLYRVQNSRTFVRWSDGSTALSRSFRVGASPQTFTAIYENRQPTAVASASTLTGQAPLSVAFSSAGSSDPEDTVLNYTWDFGDGTGSTQANPTRVFSQPGAYTVRLTVADQAGGTAQSTLTVNVLGAANTPTSTGTSTPTLPANTPTSTGTSTPTLPANTPTSTAMSTPTLPANTPTSTGTSTPTLPANTPTSTATSTATSTPTSTSTPAAPPGSLVAPWSSTDIGATGLAGSARLDGGVYTIRASGADIWDTSDAFHYAYQPWSGNGTFVVRVTGLTNTDPWAKAGIMFRESTAAGARHVMLIVTPANGVALQHRATTGGMSLHTPGALTAAPQWLMLTRSGATFTASQSSDGVTWRQVGTVSLALPADGLVGLAVTSHNNGALTTATFDQVSMTAAVAAPTATPTRTATPVGAPTATPTPTPVAGTVNGLRGEYYNNRDLTALVLQRVDATVNFSWGSGAPDPRIGPDTFSVRWTGQVEAPSSGTYTFSTVSDDGVRLWVNDVQVINAWVDQASVRRSGTIALEAGRRYTIRMEFYENGGSAVARLEWTPPGGSRQIIPSSRLFTTP